MKRHRGGSGVRLRKSVVGLTVVGAVAALSACSNQDVYVGRPAGLSESTPSSIQGTPAVPTHSGVGRVFSVKVGGLLRTYRLHLPLSGPHGPRPLVIAFHGGGSTYKALTTESGLDGAGDRGGVVMAYPQGIGGFWNNGLPDNVVKTNDAADVAFFAAMVQDISTHTRIDQRRVFAVGIGDGAVMALRVASQTPLLVTGAVAIEGGLVGSANGPRPTAPISVLLMRATNDPSLPYEGLGPESPQGPQLGARETISVFLATNKLSLTPNTIDAPIADRDPTDGARTYRSRWIGGARGTSLIAYRIQNAGGAWPGGTGESAKIGNVGTLTRDFGAASVIVQFALETRKP